jgi:hypothetical protein
MGNLSNPFIVFLLGVAAGLVCHLHSRHFWIATFTAGIVASLFWIAGCYAMFSVTAPSELGPPEFVPVVYTLVTASAGAALARAAIFNDQSAPRPRYVLFANIIQKEPEP